MKKETLLRDVGKYIETYYTPGRDELFIDGKMKSIRENKVHLFRKSKQSKSVEDTGEYKLQADAMVEEAAEKVAPKECAVMSRPMEPSYAPKRKIEDLLEQVEETFSQRLLRMIDERGLTDPEVYNKAFVDRRHFSKIRNDKNYAPNKKTVLAFTVALRLNLDEAKDLLNSAGFTFSRSSKTDIIIAYCLQNKVYNLMEVNEILDAYGQPIFE